jgi:hypothetical protein
MAVVTETGSFAVPAEKLWALVSDFGGLAKYMDGIDACEVEGEGVGALRKIPVGDDHVVESLDVLDHDGLTLVYSIISGPMPFKDYSAKMVVTREGEDACLLTWTGTFEANGVPIEKAERIAGGIYRGGIKSYRRALDL